MIPIVGERGHNQGPYSSSSSEKTPSLTNRVTSAVKNILWSPVTWLQTRAPVQAHVIPPLKRQVAKRMLTREQDQIGILQETWKKTLQQADSSRSDEEIDNFFGLLDVVWDVIDKKLKNADELLHAVLKSILKKMIGDLQNNPLLERNVKEAFVNLAIASTKRFRNEPLIIGTGVVCLETLFGGDVPSGELTKEYFDERVGKVVQLLFPNGINTQGHRSIGGLVWIGSFAGDKLQKYALEKLGLGDLGEKLYTLYKLWRGLAASNQENVKLTGPLKEAVGQMHLYGKEIIQKYLDPEFLKKQKMQELFQPYLGGKSIVIEKSIQEMGTSQRQVLMDLLESRGLEFVQATLQNIFVKIYDKNLKEGLPEQILDKIVELAKGYPRSDLVNARQKARELAEAIKENRVKDQLKLDCELNELLKKNVKLKSFLVDLLANAGLTKDKLEKIPILQEVLEFLENDVLPRYFFDLADEWLATDLWTAKQDTSSLNYASGGKLMSRLATGVSSAVVAGLPRYCSHRIWTAEQLLAQVNPTWNEGSLGELFSAYLHDGRGIWQGKLNEIASACQQCSSIQEKLEVFRRPEYLGSDLTRKLLDRMGEAFAQPAALSKTTLLEYLQKEGVLEAHRIALVLEGLAVLPKDLQETYKAIRVYTGLTGKKLVDCTLLVLRECQQLISEEQLIQFFQKNDTTLLWKDIADSIYQYYYLSNTRFSLAYDFCEKFKCADHLEVFEGLKREEFALPELDLQKELGSLCLKYLGAERDKVVEVLQQELGRAVRPLGLLSVVDKGHLLKEADRIASVVILRWFHHIAVKYKDSPEQDGVVGRVQEDTPRKILAKLIEVIKGAHGQLKQGKTPQEVEEYLYSQICGEVLCLDDQTLWSEMGIPDSLKEKIEPQLRNLVKQQIVHYFGQPITKIRQEIAKGAVWEEQNKDIMAKFGKVVAGFAAQVVVRDISSEFIVKIAKDLLNKSGLKIVGYDFLQPLLEHLGSNKKDFSSIFAALMQYDDVQGVKVWLAEQLKLLGSVSQDDVILQEMASRLLIQPVVEGLNRVVQYEEQSGGRRTDVVLLTQLFQVAGKHLNSLANMLPQDFTHTRLQGTHPSPAVRRLPEYAQTMEVLKGMWPKKDDGRPLDNVTHKFIQKILNQCMKEEQDQVKRGGGPFSNEELIKRFTQACAGEHNLFSTWEQLLKNVQIKGRSFSELVREETFAIQKASLEGVYQPLGKDMLSIFFPEGVQKGMAFLPEDVQKVVESSLEDKLIPMALRSIVDVILQPEQIEQMVLTGLTNMNAALSPSEGAVVGDGREGPLPQDAVMQEFYTAAGEMVQAALKNTRLPPIVKTRLQTEAMKQKLGQWMWASLSGQLNGKFIENSLRKGMETMASRDSQGKKIISYGNESSAADRIAQARIRKAGITKQMQLLPGNTFGFLVRSTWANAQAHFDRAVESVFGKVGLQVKAAFDVVFNWIFFRILGAVLSCLMMPFRKTFEFFVGRYLESHLLRPILENITKLPEDQPATQGGYQAFAERLVKEIHGAIQNTLEACPIPAPARPS